jgi:DNA polymerase III delta subunit
LLSVVTLVLLVSLRYAAPRALLGVALCCALVVQIPVRSVVTAWPPTGWLVVACDVGQGDALALSNGSGTAVVVDAGPDPVAVDRCLHELGVQRVPLLVLTHNHLDHVGGLSGVFHDRVVSRVVTSPLAELVSGNRLVSDVLARHGLRPEALSAGVRFDLGRVQLQVLGPGHRFTGTRSDPNNSSVVLLATVGDRRVLLSGDAEIEGQDALLASGADLRADILKVPHHGSAYSDPAFLRAVHAQLALVSVGQGNDYGHPSPLLIAELARLGVAVQRTDQSGDIAVVLDQGRLVPVVHRARAGNARAPPSEPRATMSDVSPASEIAPLTLVVGDEEFLIARALEDIRKAVLDADPDGEVYECEANSVDAVELMQLLSPSLFGGRRLIVLRSAQDLTAALAQTIVPMLLDADPETTIVFQHLAGAKGKAILETVRKAKPAEITCARITRAEDRQQFLRAELRRFNGRITPDAAAALLDAVGSDLREISAVLAQLIGDTGGSIDAAAVAAYHRGRAEVTGFAVADQAVVGNTGAALTNLRWALNIGVAPVLIADALADGVRTVARVMGAGPGDPFRLAPILGMPPWKVKRARSQSQGWSEAGLQRALGIVASLNADVKGAAADPAYALESAIRRVAAARSSHR